MPHHTFTRSQRDYCGTAANGWTALLGSISPIPFLLRSGRWSNIKAQSVLLRGFLGPLTLLDRRGTDTVLLDSC